MNKQKQMLKELVELSMKYHNDYSLNERKSLRGHDSFTPYFIHPITCMGMVLEDNNNISIKDRFLIGLSLLFHDVLEDTTITEEQLRKEVKFIIDKYYKEDNELKKILGNKNQFINNIIHFVKLASIEGGSKEEYKELQEKQKEIPEELWMIKLVDKYYNLYGSKEYFRKKGNFEFYTKFLTFLKDQVKQTRFNQSNWISATEKLVEDIQNELKQTQDNTLEVK